MSAQPPYRVKRRYFHAQTIDAPTWDGYWTVRTTALTAPTRVSIGYCDEIGFLTLTVLMIELYKPWK